MADPPVPIVLGEVEPAGRIPGNTLFARLGQRHGMGPRPFPDTGVFEHPFADSQSLRFTEGFDGLTQFRRHAHAKQDDWWTVRWNDGGFQRIKELEPGPSPTIGTKALQNRNFN